MQNGTTLSKIIKQGTTHYLLLPASLRERLTWRAGDAVCIREAGEKLVIERVPLDKLAIIRTGHAEATS
jgi:bifunctional DNA-binding transcriptional regulator/antitoxin component of YhaV-PrlF toxin-antitoxin module